MNAIDVLVLRKGTEGLSTAAYADEIRERLPNHDVAVARTPHEERELIADARVATGISITEDLIERAEKLELFVVASSGYEHLPLDALEDHGVAVVNASGIHAPGIADQVVGYLLMFTRQLHRALDQQRGREWRHYQPDEVGGSTVTIVGLGSIGRTIAERLEGFDVTTIGVRYTPEKGGPTDEVVGFDDRAFHDALGRTDYLVLSTPLTDETHHLIGPEELGTLEPDAFLINVCRGGVVDSDALLSHLQKGSLAGAAMDVTDPEPLPPDHPLWFLDNVIITPHVGGHTPKHWDRLADILASNVEILDASPTEELVNQVTYPNGRQQQATVASTDE
jgi:phosphoglycerate dehydrogenase-like enzyme